MEKIKKELAKKSAALKSANKKFSLKSEENEKCEENLADANTELKQLEDKLAISKLQTNKFVRNLCCVKEEEKSNLAREIHDEFGQQLTVIRMYLSILKGNKNNTILEEEENINSIIVQVDALFQTLREIATSLRPSILDTLGLIPSIEWQVKKFEKHTGIKCHVDIVGVEQEFEENISICFYRICQEVLTNISKYAHAKNVKVCIFQNKADLNMTISDDGKGFSQEKIENPFSMGLVGMKERAKMISADLSIKSEIGMGTIIELHLDLPGKVKSALV